MSFTRCKCGFMPNSHKNSWMVLYLMMPIFYGKFIIVISNVLYIENISNIVINYFSCGSKQIRPLIGTVRSLINEQDRFVFNFIISNGHVLKFYECTRKSCRLGSRIRDVEAFWYKTEIKIIYFMPLCWFSDLHWLLIFDT